MPKIKKPRKVFTKKSFYRFLVVTFVVIVIIGGVYIYSLRNPQGLFGSARPNGMIGGDATSVEFQGKTLTSDPNFPRGVIDGLILENPDLTTGTRNIKANILNIYPKSPIAFKTLTISVKNADITLGKGNREIAGNYAITDLTAGTNISIGLSVSETNRDIFIKDNFQATKVIIFK
jgi:hypothetical protein